MEHEASICERMIEMLQDCMEHRADFHPSTVEQLRQTVDMLRITDVMVSCANHLAVNNITETQYMQQLDAELEALQDSFVSERYSGKA